MGLRFTITTLSSGAPAGLCSCVLIDSWYASLVNFKQVRALGWPWHQAPPAQPSHLCPARLFAPRIAAPANRPQLVRSQKTTPARGYPSFFGQPDLRSEAGNCLTPACCSASPKVGVLPGKACGPHLPWAALAKAFSWALPITRPLLKLMPLGVDMNSQYPSAISMITCATRVSESG